MTINVTGYDPNSPIPGIFIVTRLGVGARAVAGARKIMLLGNLLASALARTVGSTNYSTPAGTAAAATPVLVPSPEEADALFGPGSELALMAQAVFAQRRGAEVYACPVAEAANTKATATLLFANAATSAGVVRVVVSGQQIAEVAVASGDAAATIATNVAHAINQVSRFPATATVSSATVTLTAKHGGPRGNDLGISAQVTASATTIDLNGASAAAALVRGRFGTGTATAGATADSVTNALAAIASGEWFIVAAHQDTTNVDLIKTHLATYAGITERKRQQAVCAVKASTLANAITFAQTRNATRLQIAYYRDASSGGSVDPWVPSTGVIAASVAAGRLFGDGGVGNGGSVAGELSYAACNLDGVQLGGLPATQLAAANLLASELTQALNGGLSPIAPSAANPGLAQLVKSITSYSLDSSNNLTRAVHDTSKVTVADLAAQRCENAIRADFPNKNIAPEPASPQAPPSVNIVYPSMVKGTVVRELLTMEGEGLLVNVAANQDAVLVEQDATNKSLLLGQIPVEVIPHFHSFAAELQQVA